MNLADWLGEDRPLPARYRVIESLCEIVQATHGYGRTHGAVKPQNIEITTDLQSELEFDNPSPLSSSDVPNYRAPELAAGGQPTAKSDIFSVGVVMYEVLTGTHPFVVETPLGKVGTDLQPPALRSARPDVSKDLADAVTACIERDPEWRPTDLGYVLEVLRRLRGDAGAGAKAGKSAKKAAAAKPAARAPERSAGRPSTPMFSRAVPSRRFPVVPVVVGGGILLAAGVGLWLRSLLSNPEVPGPSPTLVAGASPTPIAAPTVDPLALPVASSVPVATPTPLPSAAHSAAPTPSAPSAPAATPTPVVAPTARAATPAPAPTPTAVARLETPEPAATQAPETPPPPPVSVPAELTAVSPFKLRASGPALLDVHGKGLRPDHQAVLLRGKAGVAGFTVTRQRYMNPTLIMVFVRMDGVAPGKYSLALTDPTGILTNVLRLEVTP
jgi:hypothetical protein